MQSKKKNIKMTVKREKNHTRVSSTKQKVMPKKKIEKKTENVKKLKNGKTLLIAQEVKFARLLANNDKKVRDKVMKNLKKWLIVRSQSSFAFTETDFMRLWKGLFYYMWMSDKPLVQEDLAESLSKIVHCFNFIDTALLYTKCTFKSLAAEWFGIDRYRVDKFEMLVRKILRQTFVMCKQHSWNKQWVIGVGKIIEDLLLDPKTCLGFNLHVTAIYMEELAKICEGNIAKNIVTDFIKPFAIHLASTTDQRQMKNVVKNIFRYLIFQSDVGMEYTEKFNAWREAGFPCKNIDEMQKMEVSDEEEQDDDEIENSEMKEKSLDPRAGRVDVEIPQIPFDSIEITNLLKENKFHKLSNTKTRKYISQLINDFSKLSEGSMPFGIKEISIPETTKINPYEAAEEFLNFQKDLYSDSSKNNRKRKHSNNLAESDKNLNNEEELSFQNTDNAFINISNKTPKKKQKLIKSNNNTIDDEVQNTKVLKKKNSIKLSMKKKSKRLDIIEPLQSKKLKKISKKLNKTFPECTEEFSITNNDNLNANNGSTSSNWSIDLAIPSDTSKIISVKTEKKSNLNKNNALEKKNIDVFKSTVPWLTPVLTRLEDQNQTPTPAKTILKQATPKTDSVKKRVKIVLQHNTEQNTTEYIRQIKQRPNIPFDANRKPKAGVLKPSPLPSPVNPFYKRKNF